MIKTEYKLPPINPENKGELYRGDNISFTGELGALVSDNAGLEAVPVDISNEELAGSDFITGDSSEAYNYKADNYQFLTDMLSDESVESFRAELEQRLAGEYDANIGKVKRLLDRKRTMEEESYKYEGHEWVKGEKLREKAKERYELIIKIFGEDAIKEVRSYEKSLEQLNRSQDHTNLMLNEKQGKGILERIVSELPQLQDRINNGEELLTSPVDTGQDADGFRRFLQQKTFIDSVKLQQQASGRRITLSLGHETEFPLSNFVTADSFGSWAGRGIDGSGTKSTNIPGSGTTKDVTSLEAIMLYANAETELPSSNSIRAYVQPNGLVVFGTDGGNTHRTAAAIARGQQSIKVKGQVIIHTLTENIF